MPDDTIKAMEGTNLTIPCQAKGKPAPTVAVIKEGKDPVATSATLEIKKAAKQHSGFYICKADNSLTQPLIKRFRVVVYGKCLNSNSTREKVRLSAVRKLFGDTLQRMYLDIPRAIKET